MPFAARHRDDPAPRLDPLPGLEVRRERDPGLVAALQGRDAAEMRRRLAAGHRAYVARRDGVPAMGSPRIVLVRHGRSAHAQRGWLDADALRAWFAAYDAAGIAPDDAPPAALRAEAARAGIVVASDLPRARASAERLAPGVEIARSPLLRETPLALPSPARLRLPLAGWAVLVGARAAIGALRGEPARHAVRAQADAASAWLLDLAARHGAVLAVTHATVRAHLAGALGARGWACTRRGGRYRHWSAWTFAPGRSVDTSSPESTR